MEIIAAVIGVSLCFTAWFSELEESKMEKAKAKANSK
jgi:hypothetical protein